MCTIDVLHRLYLTYNIGSGLGCDFVGTVEDANGSDLTKGQRVAGFVHGGKILNGSDEPVYGAFAEYT